MAVLNVKDESIRWAVAELNKKFEELGRLPKKTDFDEITRARIKAFLGPWPRALEAAGLKQPKARSENIKIKKRKPKTNKEKN